MIRYDKRDLSVIIYCQDNISRNISRSYFTVERIAFCAFVHGPQIFPSIRDAFAAEKVEALPLEDAVSLPSPLLVCNVGLYEEEGTAIRVFAESRFRSEGQRRNRFRTNKKEG